MTRVAFYGIIRMMKANISDLAKSELLPPTGYLTSRLLIATPLITTPMFSRSVILMFSHDTEGAMGIIINHIIENVSYKDLFEQLSIGGASNVGDLPVHYGGPLEMNRGFVLYHIESAPHPETILSVGDVGVSSSVHILRDIAQGEGPKARILALGYAAWGPGQLESEMDANSWISVPATRQLIFDSDNATKWKHAAETYGIDISRIAGAVGHA